MLIAANNRFQALGLHLLISVFIFLCLALIIKFVWYPGILFDIEGGMEGIQLIAFVDLVVGPFLTFLVYKVGKKGLKFDLSLIAFLQLFCICYGMYTIADTRPIAIVYYDGVYYTVTKQRYEGRDRNYKDIELLSSKKPVWLSVAYDEELTIKDIWNRYGGADMSVDFYRPYVNALGQLAYEGKPIFVTELKDAAADLDAQYAGRVSPVNKKPNVSHHTNDAVGATVDDQTAQRVSDTIREFEVVSRYGLYAISVDITTGQWIRVNRVLFL